MCCSDIAITVFNNCTKDNNGDTAPSKDKNGKQKGTELVTQDSDNFEVTFNYEFLEDFCEEKAQGIEIRSTDSRRHVQGSNDGVSASPDTEEREETDDGLFPSTFNRFVRGQQKAMDNKWGPKGFNKQNHPLNIMVCTGVGSD